MIFTQQTVGNVVSTEPDQNYSRSKITMTGGEADIVLEIGTPITATGVATGEAGLIGFALCEGVISQGDVYDIPYLDINRGAGVILNGSQLPATFFTVTGVDAATLPATYKLFKINQ